MKLANPWRPAVPKTPIEWQAAVDVANLLLLLEMGRTWALVDEQGRVNRERCENFIATAKARLIYPRTPGPAGPPPR